MEDKQNNNMIPLIGAGISAASGVLGSILSSQEAEKNRRLQVKENEKTRQFNAEQAALARQYNTDMWEKQNSYNDPQQVINRLSKAGVNPALAYGGFANAATASPASQASSSGSASGAMPDVGGITSAGANAMNAYNQSKLAQAQERLINSEAARNEAELPWIDKLHELDQQAGELGLQFTQANIDNVDTDTAKKSQEVRNLYELRKQIVQTTKDLEKVTLLHEEQWKMLQSDNKIRDKLNDNILKKQVAEIKQIYSAAKLTDVQAYRAAFILPLEAELLQKQAQETDSRTDVNQQTAYSLRLSNAEKSRLQERVGLDKLTDEQFETILQTNAKLRAEALNTNVGTVTDVVRTFIQLQQTSAQILDALIPF